MERNGVKKNLTSEAIEREPQREGNEFLLAASYFFG